VAAAKMKAPCLTIIGQVVQLREKLNWFEPQTQGTD
jgi:uroporphyrin-III C-methyltransferase/precorrin-2 dehydrogenase/sirohydrochlorin ferrochelatase